MVMTMFSELLESKSSFMLAAMFVSWVAVALLALIAANLHRRLHRVEAALTVNAKTPYAGLLGKALRESLDQAVPAPCVLVFLSANCKACQRVLGDLPTLSLSTPLAIAWTDQAPSPLPALPLGTIVLDDGPKVSAALGIRATPFALVAGENGTVVKASPVNSLNSISNLVMAG